MSKEFDEEGSLVLIGGTFFIFFIIFVILMIPTIIYTIDYIYKIDLFILKYINMIFPFKHEEEFLLLLNVFEEKDTFGTIEFSFWKFQFFFEIYPDYASSVKAQQYYGNLINLLDYFTYYLHLVYMGISLLFYYYLINGLNLPSLDMDVHPKKALKEFKERIKIRNPKYVSYPHDEFLIKKLKEKRKPIKGQKEDEFKAMDYFLPYFDDNRGQDDDSQIKLLLKQSYKYTIHELNHNTNKYNQINQFWNTFIKKIKDNNNILAEYYLTYISVISEEAAEHILTKNTIENVKQEENEERKNIQIIQYEKSNSFLRLFQQYMKDDYKIIIKETNNSQIVYDMVIQHKKNKNNNFYLKQLIDYFKIKYYKNKKTYFNEEFDKLSPMNNIEYFDKKYLKLDQDKFKDQIHSLKKLDILKIDEYNYFQEKFSTINENNKIKILAKCENKLKKIYEEKKIYCHIHLEKLFTYYIEGIDDGAKIKGLRPIIPKMYILNPINKNNNNFKYFKTVGFHEYIKPIFNMVLSDYKNNIKESIKSIEQNIKKIQNDKNIRDKEKQAQINSLKISLKTIKAQGKSSNENSRYYKIKELYETHEYEETFILGLWKYISTLTNLAPGRLSLLKYENLNLWYTLEDEGAPSMTIASIFIHMMYEYEIKKFEQEKKTNDEIQKNQEDIEKKENELSQNAIQS